MAAALRLAILRSIRIPVQTLDHIRPASSPLNPFHDVHSRSLSSHGDEHLEREEVVDRVLAVVKSFPKLDPSKVTPDSHFQKDLGLDSLDNVEIVMALEEEFKLEIPDKEADKIDSCNLAVEALGFGPLPFPFPISLPMARFPEQLHARALVPSPIGCSLCDARAISVLDLTVPLRQHLRRASEVRQTLTRLPQASPASRTLTPVLLFPGLSDLSCFYLP